MSTNHNLAPTVSNELSPEARSLMNVDGLHDWRRTQVGILSRLQVDDDRHFNTDADREFRANIDKTLKDYLASKGLDEGDSHYQEVFELYRSASIDKVSETKWMIKGDITSGDPRPQALVFADKVRGYTGDSLNSDTGTNPDQDLEAVRDIDEIRSDLASARSEWAKISAKKQGRVADRRIHGHNDARDEYNQLVQELGRQELKDVIEDDTLTQDEKNAKVIAWLLEEQDKLRVETIDELQDTKVGKFVKWMNSGSLGVRLLKGAGLGVGAGVVGAAVATGAAGLAVGGALAAGVVGASRFARGYAVHDKRGMGRVDESIRDGDRQYLAYGLNNSSNDDRLRLATERLHNIFESDTKNEQIKRRKAVAWGIGSVAAGAALGYGLHAGAQALSGRGLSLDLFDSSDRLPRGFDADDRLPGGDFVADGDDTHRHLPLPLSMNDTYDPLPINERGPTPAGTVLDNAPDDSGASAPEIDIPTYTVAPGEGWFEVFDNLGVDDDRQARLLDRVGDQLVEMGVATPHGDSYWITAPGELPSEATELIMSTAEDNGWLAETNSSIESYEVDATFTVEDGHGYTHELVDAASSQGADMSPEQAWEAHQEIVDSVGSDYIDVDGISNDTYSMGSTQYETGISAPGAATWSPEAQPLVADAIDDGVINNSTDTAASSTGAEAGADLGQSDVRGNTAAEVGAEDIGQSDAEVTDEPDADVDEAELSPLQKSIANNQISSLIDSGNYSQLNELSTAQFDTSGLADQFAGMTYSDGTPLVEAGSSGQMSFNDQPDGTRMPNQAVELINNYLREAGLNTYSPDRFNQTVTRP